MMSNNRSDYGSASDWLSALRQDELWLSQLQRLQAPADSNISVSREEIMQQIGQGDTFHLWNICQHKVEPVVAEVWEIAELSLIKLKIQTIGMLSIEWLEQHASDNRSLETGEHPSAIVERLKPIFYGSEQEARDFLKSIQGMKPTQITDKVNQLVNEKKTPVVFLLWGANAGAKSSLVTNPMHMVLKCAHPSPLSAYNGFFGCGHFAKTNGFLKLSGEKPVDWQIR